MSNRELTLENAIFFFDIDDTLIDTALLHKDGVKGIIQAIIKHSGFSEIGREFGQKVDEIFDLMLAGYRVKEKKDWQHVPGGKKAYKGLLAKIEHYQKNIKEKWGSIKKWSREVFIKIAADELGIEMTPSLVEKAAQAYWRKISEKMELFDHAKAFFNQLNKLGRPIYLITSSDARLKLANDGRFVYNPKYSEKLKRQRMQILTEKGLKFRQIIVGDPEDKPSIQFFEKGLKVAEEDLENIIDRSKCLIVGDSYKGDIEVPIRELGFGLGVIFSKGSKFKKEEDNLISVGRLTDINKAFND